MKTPLSNEFSRKLGETLEKFNPWHDETGKFTSSGEALSSGKTARQYFGTVGEAETWERTIGMRVSPEAVMRNLKNIQGPEEMRIGDLRLSSMVSRIELTGNVYNKAGDSVGHFVRAIGRNKDGELIARHEDFQMNKAEQKKGMAIIVNDRFETMYLAMGVKRVELEADKIGRYSWARQGFDFARDTDRKFVQQDLAQRLIRSGAKLDLHEFLDHPLHAWEMAKLEASGKSVGQEALIEAAAVLPMVKPMIPGSPGVEEGRSYFAMRKLKLGRARGPYKKVEKAQPEMATQGEIAAAEMEDLMNDPVLGPQWEKETTERFIRRLGYSPHFKVK